LFRGARLDFNEYETVLVAANQVDLSPISSEIGSQEFEALPFEVLFGCFLSQLTKLQVRRQRSVMQPPSNELEEGTHIH
jgi:hypothetical protein